MHPVLFRIGDFAIGTYGVAIVAGLLAALWLTTRLARRRNLPAEFFYDLLFVLLLSGFIGARIFFILLNWSDFVRAPGAYLFSRQGFVFLGGFLTALAAGIWFVRHRRLPILEVADIAAPALALAHAFGRIGCFFAGCCYGKVCVSGACGPLHSLLAVQYPLVLNADGVPDAMFNIAYESQILQGLIPPDAALPLPILPVQLFESAGNALICLALLWVWRRRAFSGQIFALYMGLYGALRFGLEFLRGDIERGLFFGGRISTSQIISLMTLAAAIILWWVRRGSGTTLPAGRFEEEPPTTGPKSAEGGAGGAPAPGGRAASRGSRRRRPSELS